MASWGTAFDDRGMLDLTNEEYGDLAIAEIVKQFQTRIPKSIRELRFDGNPITANGARAIATLVCKGGAQRGTVHTITLNNTAIGDMGVVILLKAIRGSGVKRFSAAGQVGDLGRIALRALERLHALQQVATFEHARPEPTRGKREEDTPCALCVGRNAAHPPLESLLANANGFEVVPTCWQCFCQRCGYMA